MDYPTHPLTLRGRSIEVYVGARNTDQELISLDRQAHQLVEMIVEWNQALLTQDTLKETSGTWL
jgi:hypothetical protein